MQPSATQAPQQQKLNRAPQKLNMIVLKISHLWARDSRAAMVDPINLEYLLSQLRAFFSSIQ